MPVWPHMMQRTPVGIRFGVLMFLSEMLNLLNIVTIYYNSVPTCFSWKKTKRSPTNVHLYTCVMCPYSKVPPPTCFNLQISKLLFLGGKGKVKGKSKRPTGDLVAGRE